jgi:hypothetical protein
MLDFDAYSLGVVHQRLFPNHVRRPNRTALMETLAMQGVIEELLRQAEPVGKITARIIIMIAPSPIATTLDYLKNDLSNGKGESIFLQGLTPQ